MSPLKFIRGKKFRRRHRVSGPPILVVSAIIQGDASIVRWTFSEALTLTGGNVPELTIDGSSPDSCVPGPGGTIDATYGAVQFPGTTFDVGAHPSNIAPAQSARIGAQTGVTA